MVKDFRSWLGNTGNKHTQTIFERCALTLASRKIDRNLQRNASKVDSTKENKKDSMEDKVGLEIDAIFLETYVMAVELNLFGEGPPLHMNGKHNSRSRGDGNRREQMFSEQYNHGEFSSICEKRIQLNPTLLELFSIGEERLKDYFNVYLKEGDLDETYRGKEDDNYVSLKSIPIFQKEVQEAKDQKIKRVTSVTYSDLNSWYTAAELVKEIHYLNRIIRSLGKTDEQEKLGKKKDQNVVKVILLREKIKHLDKEWEAKRNSEITDEVGGASEEKDVSEVLEKELENSFFTFGSYTLNDQNKEMSKKYSFIRRRYLTDDTGSNNHDDGSIHHHNELCFDDTEDDNLQSSPNIRRGTNYGDLFDLMEMDRH